jgi:hypothetical protein
MTKLADKITRIGNRAVKKAQCENIRLGLPNVYSINDNIIFVFPDGTVSNKYDFNQKDLPKNK